MGNQFKGEVLTGSIIERYETIKEIAKTCESTKEVQSIFFSVLYYLKEEDFQKGESVGKEG